MREIGGYFELELPKGCSFINDNGVLLASCRNALELILRSLRQVDLIWIPYFTCDVVLEPLLKLGLKFKKYHINKDFEIQDVPLLNDGEFLLYTNYFGIKDKYVDTLVSIFKDKLIVDNAQALYYKPVKDSSFAYSPRKFVGIPDGGIAFFPNQEEVIIEEQDYSNDRFAHLLKRIDVSASDGYSYFRQNAEKLQGITVRKMSRLTKRILCSINFKEVREIRRRNFAYLHSCLKDDNIIEVPGINTFDCPMVYPYWQDKKGVKEYLISNKIYVPTYWPNVIKECEKNDIEYKMSNEIAFLPIDQRYDIEDMQSIINILKEWK